MGTALVAIINATKSAAVFLVGLLLTMIVVSINVSLGHHSKNLKQI
ncbi:MAG: hypothetical protein HC777_03555 [Hyphomonadaceae bacterium]|nr:hypothetical protein [Hyphomonadaceae bacterium]